MDLSLRERDAILKEVKWVARRSYDSGDGKLFLDGHTELSWSFGTIVKRTGCLVVGQHMSFGCNTFDAAAAFAGSISNIYVFTTKLSQSDAREYSNRISGPNEI